LRNQTKIINYEADMKKTKCIKIVLTGGPVAGKTSILAYLKDYFGDKILVIPEIPTFFEKHIFKDNRFFSLFFNKQISKLFFDTQNQLEDIYSEMAKKEKIQLIVCDRGLLDGAAYYSRGVASFIKLHGISFSKMYKKYDAVIWVETLATINKKKCFLIRPSSKKSFNDILRISENTLDVWSPHPLFYQVREKSIDAKKEKILEIINNLMEKYAV
jgi:hypothetical protein